MKLINAEQKLNITIFDEQTDEHIVECMTIEEILDTYTNEGCPTAYSSQESEWTPCSKRMPEEHEWLGTKKYGTTISDEVYVTFEAPDGQRFTKHIFFQNGKLSSADERHMKVWYKGAKPIAWKPFPEPYTGDK